MKTAITILIALVATACWPLPAPIPKPSPTTTTSTTSTTTTSTPPTTQPPTTTSTTTSTTTTTIPAPVNIQLGNATYAPHGWVASAHTVEWLRPKLEEVAQYFDTLLINMGGMDGSGNMVPAYPQSLDNLIEAAPDGLTLVPWVNGAAEYNLRPTPDLTLADYRATLPDALKGLWIDIEPFRAEDDGAWIQLLDSLQSIRSQGPLAVNAPVSGRWSDQMISDVVERVDYVSPMYYDTGYTTAADYTDWVERMTPRWELLAGNKFLPSIPAYSANAWHDPAVENISTAVAGMPNQKNFAVWWWWEFAESDRQMWDSVVNRDQTSSVLSSLSDGYEYINQTYIINSTLTPPAGATIEFGPNGRFLRTSEVDGTRILPIVDLRNGNNTLINPFIQGPNTGRYSRTIDGRTYLYAHEGTGIGGVDPNMEENTGIRFSGGDTYSIINPRIDSVWGDGITISGQSSNIVIDNPLITFTGRSIISNLDSKNVTINGGYGTGAFWWGINMETIGSRSVDGFDVNGLEIYYTRFQPVFADGTYFNCMVYSVDIRTNLTAEYYDPSYPGFQGLRDQAVKLDPCVQSNVSVQISW